MDNDFIIIDKDYIISLDDSDNSNENQINNIVINDNNNNINIINDNVINDNVINDNVINDNDIEINNDINDITNTIPPSIYNNNNEEKSIFVSFIDYIYDSICKKIQTLYNEYENFYPKIVDEYYNFINSINKIFE